MNISLYRFNGQILIANKISGLTPVFSGQITPYGEFDSNSVFFKLSHLYDANYAKYTFNGHDYYGAVTVKVDSKGLYNYMVAVDPLTTAWYGGCMNATNICDYSDYPTTELFDDRAKYQTSPAINKLPIANYSDDFRIVMVTPKLIYSPDNTYCTSNPGTRSYVFTPAGFTSMMNHFQSEDAKRQSCFAGSILKLYCIPTSSLPDMTNFYKMDVVLHRINGSAIAGILTDYIADYSGPNDWHHGYEDYPKNRPYIVDSSNTALHRKTVSITLAHFPLTGAQRRTVFSLHISDVGVLKFKYDDVCKNSTISTIGYNTYVDFVSGTQKVILTVNGVENHEYEIETSFPESFPMMYDNSIVDWRGASISAINTISSVASAAYSIGSAATGLLTSGFSLAQEISRNIEDEKTGTFGLVGSTGGSIQRTERSGSYLEIREYRPINLTDIQSKFGKPDGQGRNLSTLSGYVKTSNCRLVSNGYPEQIINEAEKICNGGFRII